jgi:hypothetical protein
MSQITSLAVAFAAASCVVAPHANAAVPDPTYSTCDQILVGNSSGADMGNAFHVNVRDVGNIPKAGAQVTIRFVSNPARPLVEQETGTTVNCTSPATMARITDSDGDVVFHPRIAGFNDPSAFDQVRANGVLLWKGYVQVRSTDLNGDGATDLRDLNAFRQRFESDPTAPETDFNQDGVTNGYDFDIFRAEFMRGAKGTVCP